MKILVIYDSLFGSTEKIAQAIGSALGSPEDVSVVRVGSFALEQLQDTRLILVGSPTQAFRPTKDITAFLDGLPNDSLNGIRAVAFDTRMNTREVNNKFLTFMVNLFGYAAEPIAKRLKKKGAELALPAEGFFVNGREGPLRDGELDRAAAWARQLLTGN